MDGLAPIFVDKQIYVGRVPSLTAGVGPKEICGSKKVLLEEGGDKLPNLGNGESGFCGSSFSVRTGLLVPRLRGVVLVSGDGGAGWGFN